METENIVILIMFAIIGSVLPLIMLFMGRWLLKHSPSEINGILGYRSKRSMASKAAWDFANITSGNYWSVSGLICLPIFLVLSVSIAFYINHIGYDNGYNNALYAILGVVAIWLIPFLSVIPYTEKKLKDRFQSK